MNKIFKILILSFFLISNTYAAKFSHKVGDIVENEVSFGKYDKFPLPPGKFTVGVIKKTKEFRDVILYQIDERSGTVRWSVHLFATGQTTWKYWNPGDFCKRTNVYFYKNKKGNKKFACWVINHARSDIPANDGFWKKVREYEISNNIKQADILVYSQHEYAKGSKIYGSSYYYNPELDGVPKPKNLEWDTNEFHKQRVSNYPEHEKFLKRFTSYIATLLDQFNKLNKVKGGLTLEPEKYFSDVPVILGSNISGKVVKASEDKAAKEKKLADAKAAKEKKLADAKAAKDKAAKEKAKKKKKIVKKKITKEITPKNLDKITSIEEAQTTVNNIQSTINMYVTINGVMAKQKNARKNTYKEIIEKKIATLRKQKELLQAMLTTRFSTPIKPSNANLNVSAFRSAETFPKIPFYIPGTNEIGEMLVTPKVSDDGYLLYKLDFLDPTSEYDKVRDSIKILHENIESVISGLQKIDEWTVVAQKNKLNRRISKTSVCVPSDACETKKQGVTSTEIIFQVYEDGSTSGRIQRNKGLFSIGYNMSVESTILMSSYLVYMQEVGAQEFKSGSMSDEQVESLFN